MKNDYISYYASQRLHEYLASVSKILGQQPFQAVLQNFLYYPDGTDPSRIRIQRFMDGLVEFILKLKDLPEPEVLPRVVKLKPYSSEPIEFNEELVLKDKNAGAS